MEQSAGVKEQRSVRPIEKVTNSRSDEESKGSVASIADSSERESMRVSLQ